MTTRVLRAESPTTLAVAHVREVLSAVDPAGSLDVESVAHRIGAGLGTLPVWPQVALERLVGPRRRTLRSLDLRWLHRFEALVQVLDALTRASGGPSGGPTGLSLLVERALMLDHHGWGTWSAGTSCRMLRCADGWLAVNLPRDDDLDAVPALLGVTGGVEDAWTLLERHLPSRRAAAVVETASLLGIPVAVVPSPDVASTPQVRPPCSIRLGGTNDERHPRDRADAWTVVDLTALWAGPLAGWYLARTGADVVKVEARHRPDGARTGTPAFWRRLNATKRLVELDLRSPEGLEELRGLVADADVVLDASRPRAMEGLGIDPQTTVDNGGIWCSITGHGRSGAGARRVAFGDDAAVAGGLVTWIDGEPWFLGDAAADPVAGVTAAAAVLGVRLSGRPGFVEVSMRDAVAHLTRNGPVLGTP